MNDARLMRVLVAPHISEKSTRLGELAARQVVFRVVRDARKPEIKKAVERMFEVEVDNVQVVNCKGKRKGMGRIRGRRSDWKKAYVRLKPGHDIDFLGGE
jgi:large subunit ribosomal protein L23